MAYPIMGKGWFERIFEDNIKTQLFEFNWHVGLMGDITVQDLEPQHQTKIHRSKQKPLRHVNKVS